ASQSLATPWLLEVSTPGQNQAVARPARHSLWRRSMLHACPCLAPTVLAFPSPDLDLPSLPESGLPPVRVAVPAADHHHALSQRCTWVTIIPAPPDLGPFHPGGL